MTSPIVNSPTPGGTEQAHVQLDFGNMAGTTAGRIKEPPVCVDETLRQDAMSTEDISKLAFPLETPKRTFCTDVDLHNHNEPSAVSCSSSTASRESALSDFDNGSGNNSKYVVTTPLRLERRQSEQINLKVTSQKISRNGRQTQRWFTDPTTQKVYRMVTGCVPIVEGGRILFVSSSRKPEWILPKGGWEKDEAMEESAIRECFEEAGVLGILGPRLSEIEYETRKAKKRRLDFEEIQKKAKMFRKTSSSPKREAECEPPSEGQNKTGNVPETLETPAALPAAHVSKEDLARIRGQAKHSDDTCSVASDASQTYSYVRLSLFPLYVSDVKSSWPESGRFRKVVDIDEAIRMCESRPEFLKPLIELKERNLHLLPEDETKGPNRILDR